jgi:anti-anti-sigma factor
LGIADRGDWVGEGFRIEDVVAELGDGPVYVDKQLVVTRTFAPVGLRFAGEIDMTNSHAVVRSLTTAFPTTGDPHLDLAALIFCDISGIRALVDAAEGLGAERHLLLHGLPHQIEKVIRVTGWSDLPSLVLCSCEVAQR